MRTGQGVTLSPCAKTSFSQQEILHCWREVISKIDNLMSFALYLDDIGLLRVRGGLNKAPLSYSAKKHSLVLHSRSIFAWLLIEKTHHNSGHQGVEYSYNGDYYHKAIAKLTRKFGKPTYCCCIPGSIGEVAGARLEEPNSFVSFSFFFKRLLQTFRLHNFEADLKSSAILKMARGKMNAIMIIIWSQHTRTT